ncbi:MAG: O-acetyl-ADP-ribose deacetylase [Verrucomicrobiae bacterium]|nr:O-acetyl-ADP-ribose deacetylase [Verrucomicrobiae bacterium]
MKIRDGKVEIVTGDITTLAVDAIVNAANSSLLGGGGVDGAIHRAAGPLLYEACRKLKGCATGDAKITPGFQLPAKFVIHTVGPIWKDGSRGEDEKLASCYRRCFEIMLAEGLKTIAFPAISTGAYGFPLERATRIAMEETRKFLETHPPIDKIIFVCFNDRAYKCYLEAAADVLIK